MKRFIIVSAKEAQENNYPEADELYDRYCSLLYETDTEKPIRLIASDSMEPEDATFGRSLSWVVKELNKVSNER